MDALKMAFPMLEMHSWVRLHALHLECQLWPHCSSPWGHHLWPQCLSTSLHHWMYLPCTAEPGRTASLDKASCCLACRTASLDKAACCLA